MSAAKLKLYELDRKALRAFSQELKTVLRENDHDGLITLLQLGAPDFVAGERLVDRFLRPDTETRCRVLFASMRRITKKRALNLVFSSDDSRLEERLRNNDVLQGDAKLSASINKLLKPTRLPWFLRRKGSTGGWLDDAARRHLAASITALKASIPHEVTDFGVELAQVEGDVIAHDGL